MPRQTAEKTYKNKSKHTAIGDGISRSKLFHRIYHGRSRAAEMRRINHLISLGKCLAFCCKLFDCFIASHANAVCIYLSGQRVRTDNLAY